MRVAEKGNLEEGIDGVGKAACFNVNGTYLLF
jgi:hypothetical protein